jgi:uncharacterized protein involved in exopolysaccharide biosynthesis
MSQTPRPTELREIAAALRAHPVHWIAPTAAFTVLALLYVLFFHRPAWEARQSLSIREEAASGFSQSARPGRFEGVDAMKTAQETVLELAHSRAVAAAALAEVGPPRHSRAPSAWPTQRDIEKVQDALQIKAPHGAEFGKTEVFYLLVRDQDRERAIALAGAVADQLENRLQAVRNQKAVSLVEELTRAAELARSDLDAATDRLAELERSVGGDLAELRLLTETVGGESNLRTALTAVKNDIRQARVSQTNRRQLLDMLREAQGDPTQLLATPSELLASQPSLQRLKEGLIEAQLATARLQGAMTAEHPLVQAAVLAEAEIRGRLHREIALAIRGIKAELGLGEGRLTTLDEQMDEAATRMDRLAAIRAHYANAASEVRHCDERFQQAQQDLVAARASLAAAQTASLLTRLEAPYTPNDPCGPRRAMIVLMGLLGGLATGVGIVFLGSPARVVEEDKSHERASDETPAVPTWEGDLLPVGPRPRFTYDVAAPGDRRATVADGYNGRRKRERTKPLHQTREKPVRALSLKQALARLAEQ